MIGKLIKGTSMRGLLDYLLSAKDQQKQHRPRVAIVANKFAGTTAREIAAEFAVLRALRPNLNRAVVHEALRLPAGAPEPSDEQWGEIAQLWAESMGFESWIAISHGDGHIHIAASRIRVDGSVVSDKHDWTLSERVVREIEQTFGLDKTAPSHLLNPENEWIQQKSPSQAQSAVSEKTALPLPSTIIASVIDGLLAGDVPVSQFVAGLEAAGIDVRANIASTGKVSGLAYSLGGVQVTAKAMGRAYTWSMLQRRGLQFVEARDLPALRAAWERSFEKEAALQTESSANASGTDDGSSASHKAAHAFAAAAVANFMQAAGTEAFMVFHETAKSGGFGFKEIRELIEPAKLHQMLRGGMLDAEVRADVLDPRIVVISDLAQNQVADLDRHGLQPFATTETAPGVFEVCIRLLSVCDPEPSLKVRAYAAAVITRAVGGRATDSVALPGFVNPKTRAKKGRRVITMLRRWSQVIADRGAALLSFAKRRLAEAASKMTGPDRAVSSRKSGSFEQPEPTARETAFETESFGP